MTADARGATASARGSRLRGAVRGARRPPRWTVSRAEPSTSRTRGGPGRHLEVGCSGARRSARAGRRRTHSRVPAGPGPRGPGRTPTAALQTRAPAGPVASRQGGAGDPGPGWGGGRAARRGPHVEPAVPAYDARGKAPVGASTTVAGCTNLPPGLLGPKPRLRPRAPPRPPSRGIRSGTLPGRTAPARGRPGPHHRPSRGARGGRAPPRPVEPPVALESLVAMEPPAALDAAAQVWERPGRSLCDPRPATERWVRSRRRPGSAGQAPAAAGLAPGAFRGVPGPGAGPPPPPGFAGLTGVAAPPWQP